jgi:hypothetical protein
MFVDIANGISSREYAALDFDLIYENNACLANIRRTRYVPPEESQSPDARYKALLQRLETPTQNEPPAVDPINAPHKHSMRLDGMKMKSLSLSCESYICTNPAHIT